MLALVFVLIAALTPKVVVLLPDGRDLCQVHWGLDHRAVSLAMKQQVMRRQLLPVEQLSAFEIDHIVPRELGGQDTLDNLQAQCCIVGRRITGQAHRKDVVENRLHRLVCAGVVSLKDAQDIFNADPTGTAAAAKYPGKAHS